MFLSPKKKTEMVVRRGRPSGARATRSRRAETISSTAHPAESGEVPEGMEEAMFGMGCFWGVERMFWKLPGVWMTRVGYAAGFTPNPTYQEVCTRQTGHNEVVHVIYDPRVISYEDLLKVFWEGHDPTQGMRQGNDMGTQYRSGIYTYSDGAGGAAEAARDAYRPAAARRRAMAPSRPRSCPRRRSTCRGLSPAVPRQEPGRLLRHRRDRRDLPGGPRGRLIGMARRIHVMGASGSGTSTLARGLANYLRQPGLRHGRLLLEAHGPALHREASGGRADRADGGAVPAPAGLDPVGLLHLLGRADRAAADACDLPRAAGGEAAGTAPQARAAARRTRNSPARPSGSRRTAASSTGR